MSSPPLENLEEDPAAEFLAREQADLAGIVDDVTPNQSNGDALSEGSFEVVHGNGMTESDSSASHAREIPREEPEKIKKWREEQKKIIERKDAEEEVKKKELREEAKTELEEWYVRYKEQIEKAKQTNRNAEKEYVADEPTKGKEWEGIASLCDFNPKATRHSKDISRMKSMILQLKQAPPTTTSKA